MPVTEEEVEAAAIIIANDAWSVGGQTPEQTWLEWEEEERDGFRSLARAALEAAARVRESKEKADART